MPLLALEQTQYPETLLDSSECDVADSHRWWVLHTRPRAEKTLARKCVAWELPFYLPLYHKRVRTAGRTQESYLPLFPGYVFLRGDEETRHTALQTNLIANVIPVTDQQQLHMDLVRVYRLIEGGSSLTPEERLQPGSPVVITSGPLAGLEGKVLSRDKNLRFFVEVRLLQQGVSVEIDHWMIEPRASDGFRRCDAERGRERLSPGSGVCLDPDRSTDFRPGWCVPDSRSKCLLRIEIAGRDFPLNWYRLRR